MELTGTRGELDKRVARAPDGADGDLSARSVRVLLTAAEAYPALERAFLAARSEIRGSFLVFDLATRLRSAEGLAVGETWFDLVVHTLNRGVEIDMSISDVDPIARAAMHRAATRDMRLFCAAREVAKPGARLTIRRLRHPGETGALIRVAIWPYILKKLFATAGWLNNLGPAQRAAALRDMDGAARNMRQRRDGTLTPRLWSLPPLYPVTHHQKLAVFDRRLLYIGGLDLDERRFDSPDHRRAASQTWHDVQLLVEGPVVAEARQHLETFADVVEGRVAPPVLTYLLRTVSRRRRANLLHFGPQPLVSEVQSAHAILSRRARSLIYFESQYFRDRSLARELAARARSNPALQMILILPAAPDEVAFDGKRGLDARFGEAMQAASLRILRKGFGDRLFVGSPAQPRPALPDGEPADDPDEAPRDRLHGAPVVYVHAKVSIFDDEAAIVSSANLNGRSFRWDTEAGVLLNNHVDVTDLRHRVMAHWLPKDADPVCMAPDTAVRAWRRIANANARTTPVHRQGFLLPHDFAAAEVFGRALPVVPEEMV